MVDALAQIWLSCAVESILQCSQAEACGLLASSTFALRTAYMQAAFQKLRGKEACLRHSEAQSAACQPAAPLSLKLGSSQAKRVQVN